MKFIILISTLSITSIVMAFAVDASNVNKLTDHQQWLKNRFNGQHNNLIPVVAVADMLFACNSANAYAYGKHSLHTLITKMSKERLAEKLESCLAGKSVNSDVAINYGLLGCFEDQLRDLPQVEREEKIKLVKKSILLLSKAERKKSFTQCVTDQSIAYLK